MAFAIVKSNDEQKNRGTRTRQGGAALELRGGPSRPPPAGSLRPGTDRDAATSTSSRRDGGAVFQPNGLQAKPGNVTITYSNPSPVPHSIAVATANGNVLGQVQPFTNGKQSVTLTNLAPGKYVFYCTVPGHREAGMQGDLTVAGGPTP